MQPLLLMKQTLESSVVPQARFLLSGPYTRYTEAKQFLSRMGIASDSSQPFSVDFDLGAEMAAGFTYATGQEKASMSSKPEDWKDQT